MTALLAGVAAVYLVVAGFVWSLCVAAARGDRAVEWAAEECAP